MKEFHNDKKLDLLKLFLWFFGREVVHLFIPITIIPYTY